MSQVVPCKELPGCSRCGQQQLLTTAAIPKKDAFGKPIVLELRKVCDAKKPAAAAVIDFFATGGGHDLARASGGARLLTEWTTEGMAAYGWYSAERARSQLKGTRWAARRWH